MNVVCRVSGLLLAILCAAGLLRESRADEPLLKFVSVPDFLNMDFQLNDPRLMDLTAARQAQLVAEISSAGPQASINPHVGNFIGTVENGYRGASQVLLEALAAEQADFFTISGDLLYTRWPKGSQLASPGAAQHIRDQADIYYDAWIQNVQNHSGFDLSDVYTIVGDHEIGDNDWGANKRPLIPTYREVYVDKVSNETTVGGGAYVNSPAGFEGRTYAVQRGNLLLVGLDQFETFNSSGNYTTVGSQIASVKTDVTGTQLQWLDNTLTQANNDPSIDHIIVMGHVPIAGRDFVKVQATSSGLMNATGEDGPLWQTLVEHDVDLFMPGEVHAISMQMADDLLQAVTGTNIFQPTNAGGVGNIPFNLNSPVTSEQNYMVVEIYEDRIELAIKQIETKIWGSQGFGNDPLNDEPYKNREARVAIDTAEAGFQVTGTVTIDKSGDSPVYRNRTGLFLSEWTFGAPTNVDLNGDGHIDAADAQRFVQYFQTSMAGLSAAEAYSRGDLNGDFISGHLDFRLFKDAYDVDQGTGSFAAALAQIPEPAGAVLAAVAAGFIVARCRRRRAVACGGAMFLVVCLSATGGRGAPVTGWIGVNSQTGAPTNKQLTHAATNSPVLGDGNENSSTTGAGQVALYADISGAVDGAADIALANGQKLVLTGSVDLVDIVSSLEQFRWGLFYESASPFDAYGWQGYFATNLAGGVGGALRAKIAGNDDLFVSNAGSTTVGGAHGTLLAPFSSGSYDFSMSVSRIDDVLAIDASLTEQDGSYTAFWEKIILTDPAHETYNFNRVGFLSGNPMAADQLAFSNIDVSVTPADALTLHVITSGPGAGTVRIKNGSTVGIEFDYYEIRSTSGSLNLAGWNSLDDQENGDPVAEGWDEAGGSSANLLSEININSSTTVLPGVSYQLGSAFSLGGATLPDLFFYYGAPGGSLARGIVTYSVGVAPVGDYNGDFVVDAADYVIWRDTLGQNVPNGSGADGDGNGIIQPADYDLWRANFGKTPGSGASLANTAAIPEPATGILAGLAAVLLAIRRGRASALRRNWRQQDANGTFLSWAELGQRTSAETDQLAGFICSYRAFRRFARHHRWSQCFPSGLRFFNRFERFKNQLELTGTTGACIKMLSHAVKHSVDRRSVENALSVLVQFIKAFRAGQLHFARLSDHFQQPVNLFRV